MMPSLLRQQLREQGIHPSRKLGQNFLTDKNWIQKTTEGSYIGPGDTVIEIGPGLGALTVALLEAGAEVWAVELDHRIYEWLQRELIPLYPKSFHLMQGDAVTWPKASLTGIKTTKILANLPYAITSPWLDALLMDQGSLPMELHLILQKEAADRLTASPGTKEYGPMSIRLQLCYKCTSWQNIPSSAFYPEPQVESRLVHWSLIDNPIRIHPTILSFLKKSFLHRRKQIHKCVRQMLPEDIGENWLKDMSTYGLGSGVRPEEIPVAAWRDLHEKIEAAL